VDEIDALGMFWLPAHPEDALSGRLRFEVADSIRLSLVGCFDNHPQEDEPIVGLVDGKAVTLRRWFETSRRVPSGGVAETSYLANEIFVGHHFDKSKVEFQAAFVSLRGLAAWVGRTGIVQQEPADRVPNNQSYRIRFDPLPSQTHEFSRGRVVLRYRWQRGGDHLQGVFVRDWPEIGIEYNEVQDFTSIQNDISRLQNLLGLCLDSPATVERLAVRHPDIREMMLSGEDTGFAKEIEFRAPLLRPPDSTTHAKSDWPRMLLTFDELGGLATIARWLDRSVIFQEALNSLMSVKHARQIYAENRFLNIIHAAEGFHQVTQGGSYMPEEEYAVLLKLHFANTPHEHQAWLMDKLKFANSAPLGKRLRQLASKAAPVTRELIGTKDHWTFTVAQLRNVLTHLGADALRLRDGDLLYLAESVYAVVSVCMLLECGVEPNMIAANIDRGNLFWYKDRLHETVSRLRQQLRQQP